VIIRT